MPEKLVLKGSPNLPMKILGIETALEITSVALLDEDSQRLPFWLADNTVYSENVVKLAQRLLEINGVELEELDGIAVSNGPGSFTGLRIGLSVAKGFSMATSVPLVDVSTLDALAGSVVYGEMLQEGADFLVLADAKRDEFYIAAYRNDDGSVLRLSEPEVIRSSEVAERLLQTKAGHILTTGAAKLKQDLKESHSELYERIRFLERSEKVPPAAAVSLLGREKLLKKQMPDLASLEPFYLKDFLIRSKN